MAENVEIGVRSRLLEIVEQLNAIAAAAQDTSNALGETGRTIAGQQNKQHREVETSLGRLRQFTVLTAKSMADDFKALFNLESLMAGMKMSEQFKKNIGESVSLGNTIRKLASVFGIAREGFAKFQSDLTKGLGDIGLSSEAATNALKGLAETPVRGEQQLIEYSKTAGQLASATSETGKEGDIAGGMARVTLARGGDVQNIENMRTIAEDVRRAFNATGMSATRILSGMEQIYEGMPTDLRKKIGTRALANLATTESVAGPGSSAFLEKMLSKGWIERQGLAARGFGDVVGPEGLNVEKFKGAAGPLIGQFKKDPRMMAQTLGLSEQEAEGFVRLYEALDRVSAAQKRVNQATGNLNDQYYKSMTLGESFQANLNRTKSGLAKPMATGQQFITDKLTEASKSDIGAATVTIGAGLITSMLAGGGLKSLLSMGKTKAIESLQGKEAQLVYVTNAGDIGSATGSELSGPLGRLGVGIAAMVGAGTLTYLALDKVLKPALDKNTTAVNEYGFEGNAVERAIFSVKDFFGSDDTQSFKAAAAAAEKSGAFVPKGAPLISAPSIQASAAQGSGIKSLNLASQGGATPLAPAPLSGRTTDVQFPGGVKIPVNKLDAVIHIKTKGTGLVASPEPARGVSFKTE
jgi:hypothetical protein